MIVQPRSKNRPYHLGPFPLETLPRDECVLEREAGLSPTRPVSGPAAGGILGSATDKYLKIFDQFVDGPVAPAQAPGLDDFDRRAVDIKGGAYFMDASQVGICRIPTSAWTGGDDDKGHDFAVVILVELPRPPETTNLAHGWTMNARAGVAGLRAAEIAVCLAGHIRMMGFAARAHIAGDSRLDTARLAVLAGLAVRRGERLVNPYLGEDFVAAAISTDYALPVDLPLRADALKPHGPRYWWGINGAMSGRERKRRARRHSHLSRYPMETVKRVEAPTTLILDEEVPRVSKRAAFFQRALHGDLGDKARRERGRFAFKTPFSFSLLQVIRALVPHQDGPVRDADTSRYDDPAANSRALKSLSYFLGSDLTGICEIPRYAWYSHAEDGSEITPYHHYAVVMLIDQGYETMDGASGDDWISGAQSMRAYLRGAEIAGIMAELLRGLGVPARPQTNADSDVLHIPLILWAGLGELSRIGELVLNPFVGPRFKSVVLTTDMPLEVDRPIDFGLQEFCGNCLKCARECPCDAIPFGGKIMFNGYETWKPDVERCTRYRLTNVKGSACGRCMKTCPINKVIDADGALLTRIASWLGIRALWLKPLLVPVAAWFDDWIGNGRLNPVKKWWFDHELVDGVAVTPTGTNERELDPQRTVDPATQRIAYYHASAMPPPDEPGPAVLDRKAALAAGSVIETPDAARRRVAAGGGRPAHYTATPPAGKRRTKASASRSPYR